MKKFAFRYTETVTCYGFIEAEDRDEARRLINEAYYREINADEVFIDYREDHEGYQMYGLAEVDE